MNLRARLDRVRAVVERRGLVRVYVRTDWHRLEALPAADLERVRAVFERPVPADLEALAARLNAGDGSEADEAQFRERAPEAFEAIDAALAALPDGERASVLALLDSARVYRCPGGRLVYGDGSEATA